MAFGVDHDMSLLQVIRDLLTDLRTLIRQEVALARAEVREELAQIFIALALLAMGIGTLAIGGLWILVAITRGLAVVFGWPLSAVYAGVGAALGVIGGVLLAIVWYQVRKLTVLPKTRQTLREQAQWAAHHVRESA